MQVAKDIMIKDARATSNIRENKCINIMHIYIWRQSVKKNNPLGIGIKFTSPHFDWFHEEYIWPAIIEPSTRFLDIIHAHHNI